MNPAQLGGHFWTLAPHIRTLLLPTHAPKERSFRTSVRDDAVGIVPLVGRLHAPDSARDLLVVLHGLGGGLNSDYTRRAARAGAAAGLATLRLAMRGADRRGDDFYHAGLGSDVNHVLRAPELARFERVFLIGYSLGGHVALRASFESERVTAVASVCAPLDLALASAHFDSPQMAPYRAHVLSGLKETARGVLLRRKPFPICFEGFESISSLREWDAHIVAPRFGFRDVDDYYTRESAGPRLKDVRVPTLIVSTRFDPMVAFSTLESSLHLATHNEHIVLRNASRGGHVGFPEDLDLNVGTRGNAEEQIVAWLYNACSGHRLT